VEYRGSAEDSFEAVFVDEVILMKVVVVLRYSIEGWSFLGGFFLVKG
jgi:hypothetical protein